MLSSLGVYTLNPDSTNLGERQSPFRIDSGLNAFHPAAPSYSTIICPFMTIQWPGKVQRKGYRPLSAGA